MGVVFADPAVFAAFLIGMATMVLAGIGLSMYSHYYRLHHQPEDDAKPDYKETVSRATVEDLSCFVRTIGYKTPKTNQVFMVVFRLENGEALELYIPEEMYHGLEIGQIGTVTVRDDELYSFELE